MTEQTGYELNWDDEIEQDGPDFVTLPAGDYRFEVVKFERGRHNGSAKLPPCNKAIVHLKIQGEEGIAIIRHQLFLYSSCEGLLCAFFAAIGQRKHGQRVKMDWSKVVGATGTAKVGIRSWTNDSGKEYTTNEILRFYDFDKQPQLRQETVQQELPWPEAPAVQRRSPYEPGVF